MSTDEGYRCYWIIHTPTRKYANDTVSIEKILATSVTYYMTISHVIQWEIKHCRYLHAGLRFLATNSFQQVIGDVVGIHRSTTCKAVHEFSEALCRHKGEFIVFPCGDEERAFIKRGCYELAGIPGVVGL